MIHDHDRLCIELGRLEWARQLKEEAVQDIASSAELMEFQAGQIVIGLESEVKHVYFVVIGRLEGVLFDRLGKEIHRDFFRRGSVAGLFSVLLADRSYLQVNAVEPTSVIRLSLDELLRPDGHAWRLPARDVSGLRQHRQAIGYGRSRASQAGRRRDSASLAGKSSPRATVGSTAARAWRVSVRRRRRRAL